MAHPAEAYFGGSGDDIADNLTMPEETKGARRRRWPPEEGSRSGREPHGDAR
ncbi:hypothetical protein [Allorhodopirellula solitaria]|uniref:hypothetical protein n=1 Tax=Allorhodopirellula solitaria TaxID=2527987 RepID=UPI00164660B9|nr:hypothetical protein [Allorhodopirellula solitaria]